MFLTLISPGGRHADLTSCLGCSQLPRGVYSAGWYGVPMPWKYSIACVFGSYPWPRNCVPLPAVRCATIRVAIVFASGRAFAQALISHSLTTRISIRTVAHLSAGVGTPFSGKGYLPKTNTRFNVFGIGATYARDCIVEHMRGITHRPLVLGTAVQLNRVWSRRVIRLGHTFLDCVH